MPSRKIVRKKLPCSLKRDVRATAKRQLAEMKETLVVHVHRGADGVTFSLDTASKRRVHEMVAIVRKLGDAAEPAITRKLRAIAEPVRQVYIACDTHGASYEETLKHMAGAVLIVLVGGLFSARLLEFFFTFSNAVFLDAETSREIGRASLASWPLPPAAHRS
jgi:hypothetical protein